MFTKFALYIIIPLVPHSKLENLIEQGNGIIE